MYCGHLGIGLGAKGLRTRLPLYLLLFAALAPDWVEVTCMLLRIPHTSLLSHSIPAVATITAVLFAVTLALTRSWSDAAVVGVVTLSHIGVDWITGRKPAWQGGPYIGLHLYVYPIADFTLEGAFIFTGWLIYRRSIESERRNDPLLIALPILLIAIQGVYDLFFDK